MLETGSSSGSDSHGHGQTLIWYKHMRKIGEMVEMSLPDPNDLLVVATSNPTCASSLLATSIGHVHQCLLSMVARGSFRPSSLQVYQQPGDFVFVLLPGVSTYDSGGRCAHENPMPRKYLFQCGYAHRRSPYSSQTPEPGACTVVRYQSILPDLLGIISNVYRLDGLYINSALVESLVFR